MHAKHINRLLIKDAIDHAPDTAWSLQGLGMFRYYFSEHLRLHVWVPALAVPNVSVIHDHPWDFESHVIAGSIKNSTYRVYSNPASHFMAQKIKCGVGTHTTSAPYPIGLEAHTPTIYKAGNSYKMVGSQLHKSIVPPTGAITLVERFFTKTDKEHATVCYLKEIGWVSAEPRQATASELATMRALAKDLLTVD